MTINNVDVFRQKIRQGKLCVGITLSFTDAAISELVGDAGYDFSWIDMEHCPIDISAALAHVMAARGTAMAPFVRVPAADPNVIKPVLELHPAAVVVPQIRTVEEVGMVVAACKDPPIGIRGFGPRRGRGFGGKPYPEYLIDADEQIMVMVQIEHIDAVRAIDDIVAVEGLDGVCVGFNDLAGSMGLSGEVTHPNVIAAAEEVISTARQAEVYAGVAMGFDAVAVKEWMERGIQWACLGSDFDSLYRRVSGVVERVREL